MKTIVIGTNHAGTTTVRTLRRLDPKMEVVTYEKSDKISLLGCGIALWVKDVITKPEDLFYASPELLASEGVQVHTMMEWSGIDAKKKEVTFTNLTTGEKVTDNYDKLVIATGTWPMVPPIKGIDLPNVQIIKNYYHGEKVAAVNKDKNIKRIAVVGAGYIGVELVDAFVAAGKEVVLIDSQDRIMSNYYDEEFTGRVEGEMNGTDEVELQLGQAVQEFVAGKDGKLAAIKTNKGTYNVDFAIVSVGVKPQTDLVKGVVDMDARGAIKTNKFAQTSDKDIYAVGDCSEVYNIAYNQNMPVQLATTAVRTGIIAAVNVVTNNTLENPGFTGANGIDVFDWKMASTGVTEEMAKKMGIDYQAITYEDADRPEWMKTYNDVVIKVVWEKKTGRIIGAQIASKANHTEVIYMFSLAIQKGLKIGELALVDIFFLPHFNKPYNFITQVGLEFLGLNFFKKED